MANYVDIIPLIIEKRADKKESLYEDAILQETLELEEQLPRDLAQAYKDTDWEAGWGKYNAMSSDAINKRYGTSQYAPDHNLKNISRRAAKWDLGKATYERISKQEAVDLLGMTIKEGDKVGRRWENEHEISIDDPVPEGNRLHVTFENSGNSGAIQNIDKLRFLLPGKNGGYALTEFSYKATYDRQGSKTNNYMPIFRQEFNSSVYDKYNIPRFAKGNRIDWRKNDVTYDATMVYYAIKLSDVIYKTDEYEHPIENIAYDNIASLTDNLVTYLCYNEVYRYIKNLIENYYSSDNEKIDQAIRLLNNAMPGYQFLGSDITPNSSKEDLWEYIARLSTDDENDTSIDDFLELFSSEYPVGTPNVVSLVDKIINNISSQLNDKQFKEQFNKYYRSELEKKVNYIYKVEGNNNPKKFEYIQDKLIDTLPDSRSKEIWSRRIKNSRKSSRLSYKGGSRLDPTDHTAAQTFASRTNHITQSDIPDTGSHQSNKRGLYYSDYSNAFDDLLSNYNYALSRVRDLQKEYVETRNVYLKFKDEQAYYDNQEEYSNTLAQYKADMLSAKEDYISMLEKKRQCEKDIAKVCDAELDKTVSYMRDFYTFLQYNHEKLLSLRNTVKSISNYNESDLTLLYGNKGKERLDAIEKQISSLTENQVKLKTSAEEAKNKIEELKRQIAQLEQDVTSAEQLIKDNTSEIERLRAEESQLSDGIESAIVKSYEDQEKFTSTLRELTSMITNAKLKNASSKMNTDNQHALELSKELQSDVMELKDILDDDPDEEDILTDDETNVEQPSQNQ